MSTFVEPPQMLMPKKRQQGFEIVGMVSIPSGGGDDHSPASKSTGLSNSFIDTDILLNDDLWNQFTSADANHNYSHAKQLGFPSSHTGAMDDFRMDAESHQLRLNHDPFINIPHSQHASVFGMTASSMPTFINKAEPQNGGSMFGRQGSASMEEEDSPDGSNGDSSSTFATSILSPSSFSTMASSISKSQSTRHGRSNSNASLPNKGRSVRTARSVSRSRLQAAEAGRRAERSPSQDCGGVGKAPTARSRPSRRASIGPAAQAAAQAAVNGHLRIDAQGAASTIGSALKTDTRSPQVELSSSVQSVSSSRWGMFGNDDAPPPPPNNSMVDPHSFPWSHTLSNSQSGEAHFNSGSLPTPLSFQASMQHLNIKTPPLHSQPLQNIGSEEGSDAAGRNQPYNPFLFPPYMQANSSGVTSARAKSEASDASRPGRPDYTADSLMLDGKLFDSEAAKSTPDGDKPDFRANGKKDVKAKASSASATVTKAGKMSKSASQNLREKTIQEVKEAEEERVNGQYRDAKVMSPEDEDDDGAEEEDEQPGAPTASKSEAEAKRLAEKRRRRRESHNAVERRRRDNINEKITELATLLPEAMLLDAIATSTQGGNSGTFAPALAAKAALAAAAAAKGESPGDTFGPNAHTMRSPTAAYAAALAPVQANSEALAAAQAKPNKGIILRKSVEYIRHLQQFLDMQMNRIGFLEAELQRHREAMQCSGMSITSLAHPPTQTQMDFLPGFGGDAGGFFGHAPAPADFGPLSLLDLGMSPQGQANESQPPHQPSHHQPHARSESREDGQTPSLAAWLEGFDQRTGLPRRSSVDPIEEEEHEEDEHDTELSNRRGRGRTTKNEDEDEDEGRGRSRQREKRRSNHLHQGSWPTLQVSGSQSPMQVLGGGSKEDHPYSNMGDIKMDL